MAESRVDDLRHMSPEQLIEEAQRSSKRVERKSRAFAQEVAHLRAVLEQLGIGFELIPRSSE